MKCPHGFPPELQTYCPMCTRRQPLVPPEHVKAERQSIEFWHYTLPAKFGAARERLEADNNIATALALQRIKDMADKARLEIEFWPASELGGVVHEMHKLRDSIQALGHAMVEANRNIYDLGKAMGGGDNAADWGG